MTRPQEKTNSAVRASSSGGSSSPQARARRGKGLAIDTARLEGGGAALKLLRFPAVRERTGLSRSTIWRLERQGAFPRHHRISPNAVAWVEDDLAKWIRSKVTGIAV